MNKKNYTKKGMFSLLAAGLVASSASVAVVACGTADFSSISGRASDPNTYTTVFSTTPESWNPAYTQMEADSIFLSDLYAGALANDEYGRTYGDTLESGYATGNSTYVGADSEAKEGEYGAPDYIHWNYKVRDNALWVDKDGKLVRNVRASDFDNTASYALNQNTQSQIANLWVTFILNASEMQEVLTDLSTAANKGLNGSLARTGDSSLQIYNQLKVLFESIGEGNITYNIAGANGTVSKSVALQAGGFGLKTNDATGSVQFVLKKAAPYFETALTYSSFSPAHELMIAGGANADGPANVFSGAYLPDGDIDTSKDIIYKKNESYHFASKTEITKIVWKNLVSAQGTPDLMRNMFEQGEVDAFAVSPNDAAGWEKYIGSNWETPNFDGVYVAETIPSSSWVINYNYYNSLIDSGTAEQQEAAIKSSKLLQNESARALLSTGINRSYFARYFSQRFDDPVVGDTLPVSKNLSNIYTSAETAVNPANSKDYTTYVADHAAAVAKENNPETTLTAESYAQGEEPLLNYSEEYTGKSRDELIQEVQKYVDDNELGAPVSGSSNNKVKLSFYMNPLANATTNTFFVPMFQNFNAIPNNPIYVDLITATTQEEYVTINNTGAYDIAYSGWGPDYADPYTYLETYSTHGAMTTYNGEGRFADSYEANGADSKIYIKGSTEALMKDLDEYTSAIKKTDAETLEIEDRYKEFAEQEFNLLYRDFIVMPFFVNASYRQFAISHTRNYTIGRANYGNSSQRDFLLRKNEYIWTNEQNKQWRTNFRAIQAEIATDASLYKEGNVLFAK